MCGITGIWGAVDVETVEAMMEELGHRGPDDRGVFVSPEGSGVLGHTRLSIMDPEKGHQPLFSEDRAKAIVANGEIYNFPLLLPELSKRHTFGTKNDSEAIVHLYEERGADTVSGLDGMYAFIIADGADLFAARDPIGIKPLYYGKKDNALLFASEIKALSPHCDTVHEFPPGTRYHSQRGFETFYTVPELAPEDMTVEESMRRIRETVEQSVVKRLMSDVPVGAFLSGGLDSSIIAAVARKHLPELHTFSVGVEGSSDLEAARVVARHIDSIHHEYLLTEQEIRETLPEIIYYLESFDQDLVRSAIPCFFTSRLAAEYVKVILTGEGADELYAGYTYYKDISDASILNRELRRSVSSLHNINLQRVDRMTMAHSIEGRVPFLDLSSIRLGQQIPPEFKLSGGGRIEKWILRKAFEDLLPREIAWRVKEQFDEGSGVAALQERSGKNGNNGRFDRTGVKIRSVEEAAYFDIFQSVFEQPGIILSNVARWAERPV
jgi:asparagine synthase (glutamine-hydrolysing)